MKARQIKGAKYHKLLLRIPDKLWKKIQAKGDAEYKSYSAIIIEILRNALKE